MRRDISDFSRARPPASQMGIRQISRGKRRANWHSPSISVSDLTSVPSRSTHKGGSTRTGIEAAAMSSPEAKMSSQMLRDRDRRQKTALVRGRYIPHQNKIVVHLNETE